MNSMVPGVSFKDGVLTADQIKAVRELIDRQNPSKWVHSTNIAPERGVGVTACDYDLLFDRVLTEDERQFLQSLVPQLPGAIIRTQVINRYKVGGFLCDHTDRQNAVHNTIIPLQSSEVDGLRYYDRTKRPVSEGLIPDVAGRMTIISDPFLVHGVAPVKSERFVFITIYADEREKGWNPYEDLYQNRA